MFVFLFMCLFVSFIHSLTYLSTYSPIYSIFLLLFLCACVKVCLFTQNLKPSLPALPPRYPDPQRLLLRSPPARPRCALAGWRDGRRRPSWAPGPGHPPGDVARTSVLTRMYNCYRR